MKCTRCDQEFNTDIPLANVNRYYKSANVACPHCGKLYRFRPVVEIEIEAVEDIEISDDLDSDDWCVKVVKDSEYKK